MAFVLPEKFEQVIAEKPDSEFELRGITRDDFRAWITARVKRAVEECPQEGEDAPDFTLERLSAEGARTGEYASLSEYRGLPVALIMGSYT